MSTSLQTLARRTALVLGAAATVAVTAAGPAGADVPEGWRDHPAETSAWHTLLVLVGIPLLLFVLIYLAVYLPGMIRGERGSRRPGSSDDESQWFGGPRQGTAELAGPDDEGSKAGGASARW